MRKFLALMAIALLHQSIHSQLINRKTTPAQLATIIPAFSQITTVNSLTVNITLTQPPADPIPVDADTTKQFDKSLQLGDQATTNYTVAHGM